MKKLTKVALASALASLLAFATTASAKTTLRMGYETPRTDSQHKGAEVFKKYVEEQTGGEISVKLFPDSTLGGAPALINGVRNGTVDMIIVGLNNLSGLSKELNVLDIPFIFANKDEAFHVLDGKVGDYLYKGLEGVNIKGLTYWDNGFRAMTNNKHPIVKPDDVKGIKMRVPGNPMSVKLFETLGANPVPMAIGELYTALETHTVDGQDHPVNVFYSSKFYEVQKYLTLTNHQYSALFFGMNLKKYNKLSDEHKQIIIEGAKKARDFQRQYNADNQAAQIEEFKKAGVEVINSIDPQPFRDVAFDKVSKFYTDQCGDQLIKDINAEIAAMKK